MLRYLVFCVLLTWLIAAPLRAQRVLLLEKASQSQADRIYEGQELTYRIQGDKFWQNGFIQELRPDIQAIVINDRFVLLDELESLRFGGSSFGSGMGYSFITFGLGWSAFAAVGYATDGDPDTRYSRSDLGVSLVATGTGLLLRQLFARKRYKLSEKKRLRIVDLTF